MTSTLDFIIIILTSLYCMGLFLLFIGLFFPNRRQHGDKPHVSVIIAARNEEKNIKNILADLLNQTYPENRVEIVIVNDHSEDSTEEIIQAISRKNRRIKYLHITQIEEKLTAKKNALFQGIQNSRGEIILTTDADCKVLPTWVETMVSYFTPDIGMVVGFSQLGRKEEKRSLFERLQSLDFLSLMAATQGALNLNFPLAASGQNLAYRRSAFKDVEGFKRIGHRISGDDVLLLQLIDRNTSWKIGFAPSPKSYNSSEPEKNFRDFLNQRKRWASNGSYQIKLNRLFFLFILITFLVNALILIRFSTAFIFSKLVILSWISLTIKLCTEWLLVLKGCSIYRRFDLIKIFPLWFILQIPYIFIIGLLGSVGQFIWKNRTYSASNTIKK